VLHRHPQGPVSAAAERDAAAERAGQDSRTERSFRDADEQLFPAGGGHRRHDGRIHLLREICHGPARDVHEYCLPRLHDHRPALYPCLAGGGQAPWQDKILLHRPGNFHHGDGVAFLHQCRGTVGLLFPDIPGGSGLFQLPAFPLLDAARHGGI